MEKRSFLHKDDYALYEKWSAGYGQDAVAIEFLPRSGVVVESLTGEPLCCSFLQKTNSAFAWIIFTTGDPELPWRIRAEAISVAVGFLEQSAKTLGFKAVFTLSENARLSNKFEEYGWERADGHDFLTRVL